VDAQTTAAWDAYRKLLRGVRAVIARIEPRLAAFGLTATQFGVLEVIWHSGPASQRELGRKALTSPGNMTDVVDKLEERGLVRRTRLPADRRAIQVELTQAGRSLIEPLFEQHAGDVAAGMRGLTPLELEQLADLLAKLSPE